MFGIKSKLTAQIESMNKRIIELEAEKASRGYLFSYEKGDEKKGHAIRVSYGTLLQTYKSVSWVRACVDAIKRTTISAGWTLVEEDGAEVNSEEKKRITKQLSIPNKDETLNDILGDIVIDLKIYGDAYLEIVKDEANDRIELYNLFVPNMRIKVDEHGTVVGYIQINEQLRSKNVDFADKDVIHFRLPNPGNEVYGLSPLESLQLPIEVDLWSQIYNRNFFKNDATPRGHLDMGNCSKSQLERNRKYWRQEMKGAENAHKTIVTEGGAKYHSIGTAPKDMEFLNQRKFNRDEIIAVYGVPPAKVGVFESANKANSKEQDKTFKSETIIPLQKLIAEKLNRHLMPLYKLPLLFTFNKIDLRDKAEQAEVDEIYLKNKVIVPNEIRKREGMDPVDWGNEPLEKNINTDKKLIEIELDEED